MSNTKVAFNRFNDRFLKSDLAQAMLGIREDSPYHREENVKEHTRMVVNWYDRTYANARNEHQQLLTRLALLFHDTGKPGCKTEKFSEERGVYYSYPGHELRSARLFEDYMISSGELANLPLSWEDFRTIKWMIENHLPYGMKKPEKLLALKIALMNSGCEQAYFDMLLSDGFGRISDDHDDKMKRVFEFINTIKSIQIDDSRIYQDRVNAKRLYVLVGASGSGKSTLSSKLCNDAKVVSLDNYRLEFFTTYNDIDNLPDTEKYRLAYTYCNERSGKFSQFVDKQYRDALLEKKNIILDNTNTSSKSRHRWIIQARTAGYEICSVEFPNTLGVLQSRQQTRTDKTIPAAVVAKQYFSVSTPDLGSEVDIVYYAIGNELTYIGTNTFSINKREN